MAYLYGYMAEFTDMTTGALRILLLTIGVGGGISAIRLCVRLYSGLQHLLLCLSIWRYVLHVVVVFAPVFGGLLV